MPDDEAAEEEEDFFEDEPAERKLALIFFELGPRLGKSPADVEGGFLNPPPPPPDDSLYGFEAGMALVKESGI